MAWVYVTGWVTRDGTINFRDDVYKHDDSLDRDALADVAAGGSSRAKPFASWRIRQNSHLDAAKHYWNIP